MKRIQVSVVLIVLLAGDVMAQSTPSANNRVIADPSKSYFLFSMLNDTHVRDELQLSKDQFDAIVKIRGDSVVKIQTLLHEYRGNPPTEVRKQIDQLRKLPYKAMEELLLPGQLERLRQLGNRKEIVILGYARALTEGRLGELLEIKDDQKAEVRQQTARLLEELNSKIRQLDVEKEKKLISELSTEQREKFRATAGEYFQYSDFR